MGLIPNHRSAFAEINTPTRIFEYLALGKPVIAPRAAGISDYFDEGSMIFFELGNAEIWHERSSMCSPTLPRSPKTVRRGQAGLSRTLLADREATSDGSGQRPAVSKT